MKNAKSDIHWPHVHIVLDTRPDYVVVVPLV